MKRLMRAALAIIGVTLATPEADAAIYLDGCAVMCWYSVETGCMPKYDSYEACTAWYAGCYSSCKIF